MRPALLVLFLLAFTSSCKLDKLLGHVTPPPCPDTTCFSVKVWNNYRQEWSERSTCWCSDGRAL